MTTVTTTAIIDNYTGWQAAHAHYSKSSNGWYLMLGRAPRPSRPCHHCTAAGASSCSWIIHIYNFMWKLVAPHHGRKIVPYFPHMHSLLECYRELTRELIATGGKCQQNSLFPDDPTGRTSGVSRCASGTFMDAQLLRRSSFV